MFNKATAAEPASTVTNVTVDVIPISHLQLDLDAPPEGWPIFLADRGIEIVLDDLGRSAISHVGARVQPGAYNSAAR